MSAPSLNYQLAYASGNAINAFTLHDANGAVITPASIANVASGGYTAIGTATFSGSSSAASGSPITLTAPGNYRLSTTGTFTDTGRNVDITVNGFQRLTLDNTNTPTATLAITQADINAGGVVNLRQNMSTFPATVTIEQFSEGDGWDRKNITLSEAAELIAVTPVFANPAAPVLVYLLFTAPDASLKNVLDNSVFTVAHPGRPAPRGGQENAYTVANGVWTLKTPANFDAKIKPRTKDAITGVPLFGNDFLMLWTGTNPTAIQVQVDVEDITDPAGFFDVDYTNATTYSESSVGMSMVKLTEEIIPRDGLTHALKFRIRYNCGGDVSAWVEEDWKTAVYKLAPPEAPASVSATLIRDRVDVIPDRVRVNWTWAATNPGDVVEVYAIDFLGKKHLIYEESDNAVTTCTVENVSRFYKVEQPPAVQTAYRFGVLAKNRSSKSDLTISAVVQITSAIEDTDPPTPDEVAGTAEDVTFPGLIQKFTAEVNADNSLTAENRLVITGVAYPLVRDLFRALRKVIMTGGSVTVEDIGVFKAKWSSERMGRNPSNGESVLIPAARGVGFTPSIGFKTGTKLGRIMTDAEAKAL
jgi:nucleoid DNA-binding protein